LTLNRARLKGDDVAAATARYMEYDKWQPGQGTVVEVLAKR